MSWNLIFLLALVVLIGSALLMRRRTARIDRTSEAAPVPAPSTSRLVVEAISVVLRRQVPVRWEEPARSWIGGLPQMPDEMEWPRSISAESPEQGERPLHFLAQVCCADLPQELWGGLGPRDGWLLLFIDPNQGCPDGPDAFKVLHIDALGPEREPPFDLGPVHDGVYTGPDYGFVRAQQDIPTVWRRWPVDLVTIPNRVIEGARTPTIIPQNFASILYDVAPVNDEGRVEPPGKTPFSWRGALYVVDSIARVLAKEHELRLDNDRKKLSAPGWITDAINRTDAQIAKWLASPALQPAAENASSEVKAWVETTRPIVVDKIEMLRAARQLLAESADAAALLARIEQTHRDYAAWRDGTKQRVATLRERIVAHDLDTPIAADDWDALQAGLEGDRQRYWILRDDGAGLLPDRIDQSLLDYAYSGLRAAQVQLAADDYVSQELRHLVPDELVAFMEPRWRALYSNRPHRMGGYHDGVQSEAVIGPAKELLLFQIATDDAMHWVWGDGGAYYFWIRPKHLEAKDFSGVQMCLECH